MSLPSCQQRHLCCKDRAYPWMLVNRDLPIPYLTLETLKNFCVNHGEQRVCSIRNHHKYLSWLFPLYLNTYVMGLRPLEMFEFFQCGDRLYSPESDVYRRQIVTYKNGRSAKRVTSWYCVLYYHLLPII